MTRHFLAAASLASVATSAAVTTVLVVITATVAPAGAAGRINSADCSAANPAACRQLAIETNGQCASPRGLGGCRFDSLTHRD